jgi:hypothetical protein
MDSIKIDCTISNRAATDLILDPPPPLDWGVFQFGPVNDIGPKQNDVKAFISTGQPDLPGGTQGKVVYRFEDDANVAITIAWDVTATPGASNTLDVESSDQNVAATPKGWVGSGDAEAVIITIVDGR